MYIDIYRYHFIESLIHFQTKILAIDLCKYLNGVGIRRNSIVHFKYNKAF